MSHESRLISADSHLEIDTSYWRHSVPGKYRDRVPHLLRTDIGGDGWVVEGKLTTEVPLDLYAGKGVRSAKDTWTPFGQRFNDTPGTGTAQQRLQEQDEDGVDAEVLFPSSSSRWWRDIRDDEAYKGVLRGYNDWLAQEYCAVAPDRLIGLGVIPMTNVDDAVAEMEHCKNLGLKGVSLRAFPSNKGYPTLEDDRFWAASLDLQMPVTIHVELDRSGERDGPLLMYPKEPEEIRKKSARAPAADFVRQVARFYQLGGLNVVQLVLHGLFDRFPKLKLYFAETQAGWVPTFLEVADLRYQRHHRWAHELFGWQPLQHGLPSEYVKEHIYWGIVHDRTGVEMRHHVGVNRIMWSTDFPHQESEWPRSREVLEKMMQGVPEDERYQMVTGNCVEFFRLDGKEEKAGRQPTQSQTSAL
jgi:predicted TIM-barrel fold metal-dependent hydrolase